MFRSPGGKEQAGPNVFRLQVGEVDQELLRRFCHEHQIRRLALFGSQLKGTAQPASDVDLLVEFEPDQLPGLIGISAMELELSEMPGGKKVDQRTPRALSRSTA